MTTGNRQTLGACQQCRTLKVRCVRVPAETKCMKCTKSGAECVVVPITKPTRTSRPRRLRLADLDSKLNGILNSLAQPVSSGDQDAPVSTTSTKPDLVNVMSSGSHSNGNGAAASENVLSGISPEGAFFGLADTTPRSPSLEMNVGLLDHLLMQFRSRQSYFPFVVIHTHWTAQSMINDHPFLFLAAITSVTGEYPSMQGTLALELRETMSRRIVIAGENNLDLLQGLLVHLAWYHHHLVPRSQLAYRTLYLAISMVIDLGLDRDFDESDSSQSEIENPSNTMNDWHRAAVGCYYLSSVISASIMRPNRLPFDNNAFKRASVINETTECDTDGMVQPLIRLQRIVDRARSIYTNDGKSPVSTQLHTHGNRLIADLDEWRYSLPSGMYDSHLFANHYNSTRVWIYEMGLVYHFTIGKVPTSRAAPCNSAALIHNLTQCVEAAKDYLDCFLALPIDIYPHLPAEEYFRCIMAFFVVYKLAARLPELPFWNLNSAREIIDLEQYLDVAASRVRQSRLAADEIASGDVYSVLPEILESAKASYVVARDHPEQTVQGLRAHADVGSWDPVANSTSKTARPSPAIQRGCPATGYWKRQAAQTDAMGYSSAECPFNAIGNTWTDVPNSNASTIF